MAKDTIYIEADDEITVIIDKVLSSKEKVVAIVLPKRAPVLLSVVNMKLLKKTALDAKKSIVIITSDKAIEPIAASAKVYTALSLSSKPAIPTKKATSKKPETIAIDGQAVSPSSNKLAPAAAAALDSEEPIELAEPEESIDEPASSEEVIADAGDKKSKKRFMIPDFNRFQLKLWGSIIAIILLIVGWVFGFVILPKATVTINTITDRLDVSAEFTAQTGLSESDFDKALLAATKVEVSKENTATVPATGQKDIGSRATGSVTIVNCDVDDETITVPAGTGVSAGNLTFITQSTLVIPASNFTGGGNCKNDSSETTQVAAQSAGEQFNISARSYTVAGFGSSITASGSDMSGGSTQVVKVVSAEDIKKATEQIGGTSSAEAADELRKQLSATELQPLNETIESVAGTQKVSAAVDAEAENVTVTQVTTYSMLGVKSSDLSGLLDKKIQEKIADQSKNIRSNGFDSAVYRLVNKASADSQVIGMQTVVTTGQVFDEEAIKKEVVGKKRGDIEKLLEQRDGVRSVSVEYSPLWITTTPDNVKKIHVVVNEIQE